MKRLTFLSLLIVAMMLFTSCTPEQVEYNNINIMTNYTARGIYDTLTLEQKVGQLLICSIDDVTLSDETRAFLTEVPVGNIMIHKKNVQTAEGVAMLNAQLQEAIVNSTGVPAFICVSQEGGDRVTIKNGVTNFPSPMSFAAANDVSATYMFGEYLNGELEKMGFNFNISPDLDVLTNPLNPYVGNNAYGDTLNKVNNFSVGYASGAQNHQVVTCAKIFPGLGALDADYYSEKIKIYRSFYDLIPIELMAFQDATENGIDAILVSHVSYPEIDTTELPASISRKMIAEILVSIIEFNGMVVADNLICPSIMDNYDIGQAAVLSINGGAHAMILGDDNPTDKDIQRYVFDSIIQAVNDGIISEKTLENAVIKVLELKEKYGVLNGYDTKTVMQKSYSEHSDFADGIGLKSITVAKDEGNLLPLRADEKVLIISSATDFEITDTDGDINNSFAYFMAKAIDGEYITISNNPSKNIIARCAYIAKNYDKVVVSVDNAIKYPSQASLAKSIAIANPNTVIVSMNTPFDYYYFSDIGTYVCAYEYSPPSVRGLVKVLSGQKEATGALPVVIDGLNDKVVEEYTETDALNDEILEKIKELEGKDPTLTQELREDSPEERTNESDESEDSENQTSE